MISHFLVSGKEDLQRIFSIYENDTEKHEMGTFYLKKIIFIIYSGTQYEYHNKCSSVICASVNYTPFYLYLTVINAFREFYVFQYF